MNLATSLLAAHMLWLAGSGQTEDHSACQIIAIALHYSFLSSFTWMSVIAFDTWRAFSRKTRRHNNVINWKRVGRVIALGWLPPLGFVILCVALDQSGTVTIDYGGAKGCWINNKWSNIFFFAVPVLGLLIWNIVFFVLTVVAIRKVMKQSSMAQDESNRNDLVIYAKIASLMGFTWLFGFLAPFTTYFLMFPFVICNSLQGVFIAVAFLMNGKVKKLYCNLMKKKDSTNSSSNSTKHRRYNSNRSEETQI
ncbi:predicted protein [Nematostella vectensis]|uniref:G-protein coupled receptors family 2 profile 2 domain-containing protein n=1 Tax=Nematostella vectensis TaxID=45351 RepID=A7SAS2_NEMVE|nr:predicted protein [Nematostella vectensis]|eukprot:XP_001631235.1 predicted protein [Nematostella vectensis]